MSVSARIWLQRSVQVVIQLYTKQWKQAATLLVLCKRVAVSTEICTYGGFLLCEFKYETVAIELYVG
jgi:hypothetical protein